MQTNYSPPNTSRQPGGSTLLDRILDGIAVVFKRIDAAVGAPNGIAPLDDSGIVPRDVLVESVRTVKASTTITLADRNILADPTAANVVVTLPNAQDVRGWRFTVKQIRSAAHNVTVTPVAGQLIDSVSSSTLGGINVVLTVLSDGQQWWVVT